MRIRQIIVNGLFGVFNYVIPFNLSDRITIIHGPNGSGKTALLRLIDGFFNSKHSELRSIPFASFQIFFEDESSLKIDKKGATEEDTPTLRFTHLSPEGQEQSYSHRPSPDNDSIERFRFSIEREIPGLERVGEDAWRYMATNELLSLEEALDRFEPVLPRAFRGKKEKTPTWLRKVGGDLKVRFIQTQRLLRFSDISRARRFDQPFIAPANSAVVYSKDLATLIKVKLAEYAELSQSLDRTFPTRLVRENSQARLDDGELRARFSALEDKRLRLTSAGFLDKEIKDDFQITEQMDEHTKSVFSVYVRDTEEKLSVFDSLLDKIDLLKKVVNQRFRFKKMDFSKEQGFVFTTSKGDPLPLSGLSSGEQHELVLLYEMLFKVPAEALILIDEPELSLHVAWQKQFLSDLQQITDLASFDVVLATHSPQIIHDRWDLTVELKGAEK